ncbi:MAG: MBL fold metallo-hydrolase [bacterium]|nr:MBL fold metallo-hydrolase [bacterium]
MNPLRWTVPAASCALLAAASWSPARQDPALTTHAVAGSVHYIEGPGGNIGICIGDDGVLVIDDKFAQLAEQIDSAIDGLSEKPLRFLLNTHWHGDHTGANAYFGEQGVPILAHDNVRARLAGDEGVVGNKGEDTPAAALPLLTYDEGITLHLNGERIDVMYFGPGHTDGDSIVIFNGSNVVHMGDLYFNGMFPFIDLDSGGTSQGFTEVVGAIAESLEEGVTIIPGHGPISDLATLKTYRAMLVRAHELVAGALAEGKTAEEMVAANLLKDYEDWSWRAVTTERFIETIVKSTGAK